MDPDSTFDLDTWRERARSIERGIAARSPPDLDALDELGQNVADYCDWRARDGFAATGEHFTRAQLSTLHRCARRILDRIDSGDPMEREDVLTLVRLVRGSDEATTTITRTRRSRRRSARRLESPSQLQFAFMRR